MAIAEPSSDLFKSLEIIILSCVPVAHHHCASYMQPNQQQQYYANTIPYDLMVLACTVLTLVCFYIRCTVHWHTQTQRHINLTTGRNANIIWRRLCFSAVHSIVSELVGCRFQIEEVHMRTESTEYASSPIWPHRANHVSSYHCMYHSIDSNV